MIEVEGRRVKVVTGSSSQTVNVYADNDVPGVYDPKLRIRGRDQFVTQEQLAQHDFGTIGELVDYLKSEHGAQEERTSRQGRSAAVRPAPIAADGSWGARHVEAVEDCINKLIESFVRAPYLHRVEHSLHCELFRELTAIPDIDSTYEVEGQTYRVLQKEWPETIPRPEKSGRRGGFDLVILGPRDSSASRLGLSEYCDGLLEPAFAIELGLDYGVGHLKQDAAKLVNSRIQHGYLVHFARDTGTQQSGVEEVVRRLMDHESEGGPRVAYAYYAGGRFRVRKLGQSAIAELSGAD
jgi:hypothetical protein